ncbi:enolase [Natrialba magadii ATCC 43099]|uniref:Enolase n=1 Tax=Natrialba magadii (strain ATCC 43099 / DSM 3394 / CCM 3739 / CIP 104546 / IAM 13178 / JCM 8861 / NBRC 102185 / NCIMB 2190 / MS3) TaxID=547559 RepID=D3SXX7_NATMM|nr:phosphopyruvate hydratase [Natrialba magadii]ADD04017.1 enolase [Natrialba magadii ATCC 43099]ELY33174.1 enolase [Natrialba magadii ATCC 43099]
MTLITDVRLRRVLDSRGNPTVEADVLTESGGFGRAAAPSGASTGEYEAVERPPTEAIAAAREHAVPRLVGEAYAGNQREVDSILHAADGTDDFSKIGANSAVAISMAAAKAGADVLGAPLFQHLGGAFRGENFPIPLGNVVGGGEHAADATDIQEFLTAPVGAPSVADAVFANAAVHGAVADLLEERDVPSGKGDEGAWAPSIEDEDAFEIVDEAVSQVEDDVGFEIRFGLDVAAAEMYDADSETYEYESAGISRDTDEQIEYIADLVDEYDLVYVEDPFDENDYEAFAELTDNVGDQTLICGDDLFVTNTDRLADGIDQGAANSILIKPNQIGTLTDAFDAIELATENGYDSVVSHRSGETEDTTIAHLAVATDVPFIKTGAVGGERTAKLNELIRIADDAT